MKSVTSSLAIFFAVALLPFSASAQKHDGEKSSVVISDAWARTTVPGGRVSAAYMRIRSPAAAKLVKVETPVSEHVELHNMTMQDGVMEMKAMDAIPIPANKPVELKPGGMHVMLLKVSKPINTGDTVPLTLTFEGADKKIFTVQVDAKAQEKAAMHHKH